MRAVITIALALAWSAAASAQVVTTPEHLARERVTCTDKDCESPVAVLSRHLTRGDVVKLQNYAAELLATLAKNGPPRLQRALGDVNKNYYRLVWECREENGTTSLKSFVVHNGEQTAIHTLPGITQKESQPQLLDVFISANPDAILSTQYMSTPAKDPLASQIPGFVKDAKVVDFLSGLPLARGEAASGVATTYAVARPILPLARADLSIEDTLIVPGSTASLRRASDDQARRLAARDARLSQCGQKLARADAAAVTAGLASQSCSVPADQPDGMTEAQVGLCRASLLDALADAFSELSSCRDNPDSPGPDPLLTVDKAFTDLVSSMKETRGKPVPSKLANTPRTRYSFGFLTAAVIGSPSYSDGTVRVKIGSNGSIIHDPLPTLMTMGVVNIHPRPYDSDSDRSTWAERVRLFAGVAITPDFGLGGGVGVMIIRGLSVNAGWANLFVKTPRAGFSVGQTPPPDSTGLSVGNAGVWFAGLTFSSK